jgi:hypothetical protein
MKSNKGIAFALYNRILYKFSNLTVRGVVEFLWEYDSLSDTVIIPNLWTNRDRGKVWELQNTHVENQPARDIRCTFFGGPPGARDKYNGSILTILLDRVMACALEKGWAAARPIFPKKPLTMTNNMV